MSYTPEDIERLARKIFHLHYPDRQWAIGAAPHAATLEEQERFRTLAHEQLSGLHPY
ncbi:hypothetical protein LV564_04215 [Komagataeibacter nataicola]|uniref:hypothetical protein n=1 Tax=Komagataeibacter nataicola TaxID=265960 RepID=UPI001428CF9B|nr:hypothetical protein [Komagataeibacter nataicola]WEQ56309.1 hypothetical protein LV564_04215 [Komagataeibacter nataicola]WNM07882.1 hypothetical protein RI056_12820 [Komagataeibacter nataicola]GBR20990.1 hypothetical protein AA0616_1923 [Komagataeibacter nataicola NRIC 0616]